MFMIDYASPSPPGEGGEKRRRRGRRVAFPTAHPTSCLSKEIPLGTRDRREGTLAICLWSACPLALKAGLAPRELGVSGCDRVGPVGETSTAWKMQVQILPWTGRFSLVHLS
jgi:hypothetical protein